MSRSCAGAKLDEPSLGSFEPKRTRLRCHTRARRRQVGVVEHSPHGFHSLAEKCPCAKMRSSHVFANGVFQYRIDCRLGVDVLSAHELMVLRPFSLGPHRSPCVCWLVTVKGHCFRRACFTNLKDSFGSSAEFLTQLEKHSKNRVADPPPVRNTTISVLPPPLNKHRCTYALRALPAALWIVSRVVPFLGESSGLWCDTSSGRCARV